MQTSRREWWRSRWWMPSLSLFLGGLVLAAFWIGGSLVDGPKGLAVMAAVGLLFLLGLVALDPDRARTDSNAGKIPATIRRLTVVWLIESVLAVAAIVRSCLSGAIVSIVHLGFRLPAQVLRGRQAQSAKCW
jgi:hypothetical protein